MKSKNMPITPPFARDANRFIVGDVPASVALEKTYDATISSSTSLTLNASTTIIEVTAIDKAICYKWGGTCSTSDFDGIVPSNTSKLIPVPVGQTSIQFIEQTATAILAVVEF